MASRKKINQPRFKPSFLTGLGVGLVLFACLILYRLFHDAAKQELRYSLSNLTRPQAQATPVDSDFGIIIDRIGANARVIQDVDPFDGGKYQLALKEGVAHAKGTKLPGQGGNIFLFAHSSADLLTAERYNSVFYLIHHLGKGDIIRLWYDNQEHDYAVIEKRLVSSKDIAYLTKPSSTEQLTLMTCWPPGTNLKRLIVIAKPL